MFCYDGHSLENGICEFVGEWQPETCFSICVLLTCLPNQNEQQPEIINSDDFTQTVRQNKLRHLLPGLWKKDHWSGGEMQQQSFHLVKADSLGNVEYMVVYINSVFMWGLEL